MLTKEEILGDTPTPIFLIKCCTDFKFFAENCLVETSSGEKIKIYPFQMKWIDKCEKNKRIIIESGTGSSKTETMGAMYVVWKMLKEKNYNVLLISKTLDQSSSNLLSRVKRYIENNEFLSNYFIPLDRNKTWNATEIITKNKCWIKNVPYNDHIRGFRAHLIICDEIDSYENTDIFFEHVLSRLFPNGQLIGISTPVGPTRIIGMLKEKEAAGILSGWAFIKTPYLIDKKGNPAQIEDREQIWDYESIWAENWSLQKLYDRWGEQGKSHWMRNYMCVNIGEIDDAIFPINHIIASFDYNRSFESFSNPDSIIVISADFAISEGPRADFDAYVVTENYKGQIIIKNIETYRGLDTRVKINRLQELYEQYDNGNGTIVVVDPSNVGTDVMNGLLGRGIPVIDSSFASASRAKLYRTLSNVLASRRVVIPRNPQDEEAVRYSEELKTQLTGFKRKTTEAGNEIIDSKAAHDDIAASLAMNINETIKYEEMDVLPVSG
jgi:hypothetical protein